MGLWFIILFSISLCVALKFLLALLSHTTKTKDTNKLSLPSGPLKVPIIGNFFWLYKSFSDIESILCNLRHKYGPIITLHIGSKPLIFITTPSLAHQALIQNGVIFSDRPPAPPSSSIITSNQHSITAASYGPLWRTLRRNLTSEFFHHSRVKSYANTRKWVLETLKTLLKYHVKSGEPVEVMEHFQYSMFCLLAFICFGEKLDEKTIKEIADVERALLIKFIGLNVLSFFPILGKIIFRKQWLNLLNLRNREEDIEIPLIKARRELKEKKEENETSISYVDTLLDLQIPDEGEGRKLTDQEIVSLCSEFLNAGTDTTSTALEWIMANLVKQQEIQEKLYSEIKGVIAMNNSSNEEEEISEDDLQKMPYLKAIVLEGLRRHPPAHFVLPHAVMTDTVLDGHVIPKDATVNFMVADMGLDPKVWKDPMEFRPERFLGDDEGGEVFDITGTREIKMMPFGAGRRICPGLRLALLHLEYFVANLVNDFKWTAVDGDDVDLTEKVEFTVVMKNPLRAHLSPRS